MEETNIDQLPVEVIQYIYEFLQDSRNPVQQARDWVAFSSLCRHTHIAMPVDRLVSALSGCTSIALYSKPSPADLIYGCARASTRLQQACERDRTVAFECAMDRIYPEELKAPQNTGLALFGPKIALFHAHWLPRIPSRQLDFFSSACATYMPSTLFIHPHLMEAVRGAMDPSKYEKWADNMCRDILTGILANRSEEDHEERNGYCICTEERPWCMRQLYLGLQNNPSFYRPRLSSTHNPVQLRTNVDGSDYALVACNIRLCREYVLKHYMNRTFDGGYAYLDQWVVDAIGEISTPTSTLTLYLKRLCASIPGLWTRCVCLWTYTWLFCHVNCKDEPSGLPSSCALALIELIPRKFHLPEEGLTLARVCESVKTEDAHFWLLVIANIHRPIVLASILTQYFGHNTARFILAHIKPILVGARCCSSKPRTKSRHMVLLDCTGLNPATSPSMESLLAKMDRDPTWADAVIDHVLNWVLLPIEQQ